MKTFKDLEFKKATIFKGIDGNEGPEGEFEGENAYLTFENKLEVSVCTDPTKGRGFFEVATMKNGDFITGSPEDSIKRSLTEEEVTERMKEIQELPQVHDNTFNF